MRGAQRLFTNVLVGVDGLQGGRDAIALARTLAAPEACVTLTNLYVPTVSVRRVAGDTVRITRAESSHTMLEREAVRAGFDATVISMPGNAIGSGLHELAHGNMRT